MGAGGGGGRAGGGGGEPDQAEDAIHGLAAAQRDDFGRPFLGLGQRREQRFSGHGARAVGPRRELTLGKRGGREGVAAEEHRFAAEDVAGDGEAGKRYLARRTRVVEPDHPAVEPPGQALGTGMIDAVAGCQSPGAGLAAVNRKIRANLKSPGLATGCPDECWGRRLQGMDGLIRTSR